MGHTVIALYRPHKGKERELLEEVKKHLPTLREQGLVTERASQVLRAKDGTLLEIFEWKSQEAVDQAHANPAVKEMWDRFAKVCSYATLESLAEAKEPFPHFEAVDF